MTRTHRFLTLNVPSFNYIPNVQSCFTICHRFVHKILLARRLFVSLTRGLSLAVLEEIGDGFNFSSTGKGNTSHKYTTWKSIVLDLCTLVTSGCRKIMWQEIAEPSAYHRAASRVCSWNFRAFPSEEVDLPRSQARATPRGFNPAS